MNETEQDPGTIIAEKWQKTVESVKSSERKKNTIIFAQCSLQNPAYLLCLFIPEKEAQRCFNWSDVPVLQDRLEHSRFIYSITKFLLMFAIPSSHEPIILILCQSLQQKITYSDRKTTLICSVYCHTRPLKFVRHCIFCSLQKPHFEPNVIYFWSALRYKKILSVSSLSLYLTQPTVTRL